MKHKKHLRKQSSGRSSANAIGSDEKDSSDYEDMQGDGEDDQDEEIADLSNTNYDHVDVGCKSSDISQPKKECHVESSLEGKLIST